MNEIIPVKTRPVDIQPLPDISDLIPFEPRLKSLREAGDIQKSTLLVASHSAIARAWITHCPDERGIRVQHEVSTGRLVKSKARATLTITRWK